MRVAVVAGPDPGHAFPCLAVACALRDRGHDVLVATGTGHAAHVEGEGLTFVELPLLRADGPDRDIGHRLWRRPVEMAPPLAERLRPHRPDVVVVDVLTRAGAFAAELVGAPWVEVSPHHLMDPDPAVPPVGLGRATSDRPWRRWDDGRIRRAQEASLAAGRGMERAARRDLGLPADGGAARARLLATLPALEPDRETWPRDAHVVGPLEWEPPWPPLDPPPGDAPLVVVTDSTASTIRGSLAGVAARGLRGAGLRVVVTTGRADVPGATDVVVGRGGHAALLDQAAVAVSPAGHGFVGKALVRGVPVVAVPLAGDQRETSGRLRHTGSGVWLPPWALAQATLRLAVLRAVHDPRLREAAQRVGASGRGLGAGRAAELVERAAG